MTRTLVTINLPGLPTMINLSGVIGWGGLGIVLFIFMTAVKDVSTGEAILGALIGMALHALVCTVHHAGHAYGARRTGYPMRGWMTFWVIGTSLYPKDEPELPAETHIRRALGGQYFSLPLLVIAVLVAISILPDQGAAGVLAVFFVIDSFVFSLGAFMPTPIVETDGTTLLHWWPRRGQPTGQSG